MCEYDSTFAKIFQIFLAHLQKFCHIKVILQVNYTMKNLGQVELNKFYTICGIVEGASMKIKRRLLELGLTVGQKVRVLRRSLAGGVLLIEIRGYTLSLRRDIASLVEVEK